MITKEYVNEYEKTITLDTSILWYRKGYCCLFRVWITQNCNGIDKMWSLLFLPVKPAHRGFLRKFLNNANVSRGKCAAFKAGIEAAKGQVNNFKMRN